MPVVLQPDTASDWLAGKPGVLDAVGTKPLEFQAWPVDRKVNEPRNEGPELIRRVARV
jgi:putative SOS response-associated peptidase YedK